MLGYTEGYTSPEQYIIALDKKSIHAIPNHTVVDEKSDIYSVGATFYHLITGHKLERRRSGREYEELQEHVSEGLASVIMKAIVLERDKRYANAYEMYQACVHLESGQPLGVGRVYYLPRAMKIVIKNEQGQNENMFRLA